MSLYALVPEKAKNMMRMVTIFLVSIFLFGMAGIMGEQNLQIEGFWFFILTGTFGGVIVHFLMGKIIGPLFFGRSWCGWGCWTMMVLDLLPFKNSSGWKKDVKQFRYLHFAMSFFLVAVLAIVFHVYLHNTSGDPNQQGTPAALYWFLAGNGLYYITGIIMAIIFRDNRAFCKYLCPVSVFLKIPNVFSVLRIKGKKEKCTQCNSCVNTCLFNINIPEYIERGERVQCSECVMCMKCIAACPEGTLTASIGFDIVTKDRIKKY